jgi:hypothetical protein
VTGGRERYTLRASTCFVGFWYLANIEVSSKDVSSSGQSGPAEQSENLCGITLMLGNTGVTEIRVVERGALQRYEASEDQTVSRIKVLKVQGGARGGELPRE